MYYLVLLKIISLFAGFVIIWQTGNMLYRHYLWYRIAKMPFPPEYRDYLQKIPHYWRLPENLRRKIEKSILYFISTKEFRTVDIALSDEMKVVIAFYACLMQLGQKGCYDRLKTIIIYPNDVITKRIEEEGGVYRHGTFVLEGESSGGTMVIAWNEARKEAYHPHRHNVIVHELAHELDYEDGSADGIPPLEYGRYAGWAKVMFHTWKQLRKAFEKGRYLEKYKLIGSYAAKNEAEFFAVVSELFFEKPEILKKHFPDVYRELVAFYGLDTASLFSGI